MVAAVGFLPLGHQWPIDPQRYCHRSNRRIYHRALLARLELGLHRSLSNRVCNHLGHIRLREQGLRGGPQRRLPANLFRVCSYVAAGIRPREDLYVAIAKRFAICLTIVAIVNVWEFRMGTDLFNVLNPLFPGQSLTGWAGRMGFNRTMGPYGHPILGGSYLRSPIVSTDGCIGGNIGLTDYPLVH